MCRLWEEGWKQRYYKNKFDVDASDEDFRKKVVRSYVEGLCWVLRYYYQVSGQLFIPFRLFKRSRSSTAGKHQGAPLGFLSEHSKEE